MRCRHSQATGYRARANPAGLSPWARSRRALTLAALLAASPGLAPALALAAESASPAKPAAADAPPSTGAEHIVAESIWEWGFGWDRGFRYTLVQHLPLVGRLRDSLRSARRGRDSEPTRYNEVALRGRIGARLHLDAGVFGGDNAIFDEDYELAVRRSRIYTTGEATLLLPFDYKVEFGLSGGSFVFESGYVRLRALPWIGNLTFGFQDPPVGLENMSASTAKLFMESATPTLAFTPGTRLGLRTGRPIFDHRVTWALGLFSDLGSQDFGDSSEGFGRIALRVTGLPRWNASAAAPEWIHLGASITHLRGGSGDSARYRARPETFLTSHVVDTGDIEADASRTWGLEFAAARGPVAVQAEYLQAWIDPTDGSRAVFHGLSWQAGVSLTGEFHGYDRDGAVPTRIVPASPLERGSPGWGAFEAGMRTSWIDLDDGDVRGGQLWLVGLVLNWYWNEFVRLQWDAHIGYRGGERENGSLGMMQLRAQLDL
jgi:phosphate-selective porin